MPEPTTPTTEPNQTPKTDQGSQTPQPKTPETADKPLPQEGAKKSQRELIQQGIVPATKKKDEPGQADESFTKIDPSTLPAELQPVYKSMLADYTRSKQVIEQKKGSVTEQDRKQLLNDALNSLTDEEFQAASQHPVFVSRLMNYLGAQGLLNQGAQQQQQQPSDDLSEDDLALESPLTRKLYEQNKKMESIINDLQGRVENTDVQTRNAAIQAEDARLQSKYQGLYDPSKINSFLSEIQQGRSSLSREMLFKMLDYDNAVQRAYQWGSEESYQENPSRNASSMLSGIEPGGQAAGYQPVKPQKGENRLSYFQRLWQDSKDKIANGERSPFVRQG